MQKRFEDEEIRDEKKCVKLPVGLQLIGKPLDEVTVLRAAHAYEQAR